MSRYLFGAVAALALVLVFADAADAQQRGQARGRGNRGANVVQRQRVVNRGRPAVVNRGFNRGFVRGRSFVRSRPLFVNQGFVNPFFTNNVILADPCAVGGCGLVQSQFVSPFGFSPFATRGLFFGGRNFSFGFGF